MYGMRYEGMNEICTRLSRTNIDKMMLNFHDTTSFNIRPHLAKENIYNLQHKAYLQSMRRGIVRCNTQAGKIIY